MTKTRKKPHAHGKTTIETSCPTTTMFRHCSTLFDMLDIIYVRPRQFVTGGGRLSPQLPLTRPNRTDARWTVQKQTHPSFERQSSQFLCLYNCPSLLFGRTSRSLELHSRIYAHSNIYASIYAKLYVHNYAKLKTFITRRGNVRFR